MSPGPDLLALFGHFLVFSLLSIGGAITVAPEMHRVLVSEMGALTDAQFTASIAIAQAAPALGAATRAANDASNALRRTEKVAAHVDTLAGNLNALTLQLTQRVDSIERITRSAEQVGNVAQSVGESLVSVALPKISDFIDDLSRNSRALERALADFKDQPQSLVFGRGPTLPGPGEEGFVAPAAGGR
jgi:methyl-accepting chemotaxis protein